MIGYYGAGAYQLLDRASGKFYKLRDVIFEEGKAHLTGNLSATSGESDANNTFDSPESFALPNLSPTQNFLLRMPTFLPLPYNRRHLHPYRHL